MQKRIQAALPEELAGQQEYMIRVSGILAAHYAHPPSAYIHTYGCQQNVSDSEKIKGMLAQMGYGFTDTPEEAQLVIYNTCAIRENAEDRVFGNVGALKPIKSRRPGMLIGLCGCMMQQDGISERIKKSYPYVDLVFGTHALHQLPELLYRRLSGEKRQFSVENQDGQIVEGVPLRRDGHIKANLPIMYGCNNFCSYCIVPYVRGRERSRKAEDVLTEARELALSGYKEITLLGQNVNSYGKGLEPPVDFAWLLEQIDALPGDFCIRFMTSHPKDCTRRLIDSIAGSRKICRHIHLPVQSGSSRVLEAMNRGYTAEAYLDLIRYAKERIPGITFSSDIIVGFPGESRADFEETLALVRKVRYNGLFTFIYSPRPGTKASSMEDPIPAEEKSAWFQELLDAQSQIREQIQQGLVGQTIRVLADGPGKSGAGWLSGRSDANDIVEFVGPEDKIGQFVQVRIERAQNWAAFGTLSTD